MFVQPFVLLKEVKTVLYIDDNRKRNEFTCNAVLTR